MRTVELKIVVSDETESNSILHELEHLSISGVTITLDERESTRWEKQLAKKLRD